MDYHSKHIPSGAVVNVDIGRYEVGKRGAEVNVSINLSLERFFIQKYAVHALRKIHNM